MEWYEHRHDEDRQQAFLPEMPHMPPEQRLALRFSRLFGVEHCHLVGDFTTAARVAMRALFTPALGERAAFEGDEMLVIASEGSLLYSTVTACGGRPISFPPSPDCPALGERLEASLSMSTRAVLVEHAPCCLQGLPAVRNFCNKYDLWLIEWVRDAWDARYQIDGKDYAAGAIGDWSICDLTRLGIRGAAILTRDDFLSSVLCAAIETAGAWLPAESAEKALQNPLMGGACP